MKKILIFLVVSAQALLLSASRCSDDEGEKSSTGESPDASSPAQENTVEPMIPDESGAIMESDGMDRSDMPTETEESETGEEPSDDAPSGEITDY